MNDAERLKKALFVLRLSSQSYEQINISRREIDRKVHDILVLTATMSTLFVTIFYYLLSSQNLIVVYRTAYLTFFLAGITMFLLVILLGVFAYRPWSLTLLNASTFTTKNVSKPYLDQVKIAVTNIVDMTKKNRGRLEAKAGSYRLMVVLLMLGVTFLVIGFALLALPYLWPLC
jgi:glucan phosphoethanolaminetransferase (alkaline phosphatase superfamily)